jgi:hypothetical protein
MRMMITAEFAEFAENSNGKALRVLGGLCG